jgi:hypothetical protein
MDKKLLINVVIGALIALAIGAILNKLFFASVVEKMGKSVSNYETEPYETIEDEDEILI